MPRQGAGIDPAKSSDALLSKPCIKMSEAPIIGRIGDIGAQNTANGAGAVVFGDGGEDFNILVVKADITDMRKGEDDDLAGIGQIAEDFLIACHSGIEAELALYIAIPAESCAVEAKPIGEFQGRGSRGKDRHGRAYILI